MHATKPDFLRHISHISEHPSRSRGSKPRYVAAIEALDPDFDLHENGPLLDAFETLLGLTLSVTAHVRRGGIGEKAVRHAAGKRGGFSLPAILPVQFRLGTKAFRAFTLESIIFRCNSVVRVSPGALSVLQTIFEALQDGVVKPITIDGRDKLRLDSTTNGVACEIFVVDSDAVGMTDSTGEDDDTEDDDMEDDQDTEDPSDEGDEADEAVMLELAAQEENESSYDDEIREYSDFSSGDDSSDDE